MRDLPGVHDLLVTVARAVRKASVRELGTSQGVPEPHGFAVRIRRRSSVGANASIASRSTFVTIAIRPSASEAGQRRTYNNFRFWKTEIFLIPGIDRILASALVGQIACGNGA